MTEPREALEEAGDEARIVSSRSGRVRAWDHTELRLLCAYLFRDRSWSDPDRW